MDIVGKLDFRGNLLCLGAGGGEIACSWFSASKRGIGSVNITLSKSRAAPLPTGTGTVRGQTRRV